MVKYIIHTADIHIRNNKRLEEYQKKLLWFVNSVRSFTEDKEEDECVIVIVGDLLHSKTEISPEAYAMASWFLGELDRICKTLIIAGNHDKIENQERLDPISAIFSMCQFRQTYYLDKILGYQSDCLNDDNIVWCLYSSFDDFTRPNIEEAKLEYPDATYVALFHGELNSAKTDVGYSLTNGFETSYFDGVNFGLLGHIHKRQCIKYDGIPLVYSGSLIQQDHGENISGHGYCIWDVEDETYKEVNFNDKEYGYYTFKINDVSDIENNEEEIINL